MKTYQQMAFEVLKARDAYQLKKQQKITGLKIACPVALSFSFAVMIGLNVWEEKENLPQIQTIPETPIMLETTPETEASSESEFNTETLPEVKPISTTESAETLPQITTEAFTAEIIESVTEVSEIIPDTELITEEIFIPETEAPEIVQVIPETTPEQIPTEAETSAETVSEPESSEPSENTSIGLQKIFLHVPIKSYGTNETQEVPFQATGKIISSEYVGEWFDTVDVNMHYPDGSTELLEHIGEAYFIQEISGEAFAAVQFEGDENYYLFRSETLSNEEYQKLLEDFDILQ